MSATMQAVVIHAYGDNSVVQLLRVARPEPGAGDVRVRVHAAGVNPIDWKIREGAGQRMGMTLPIHLGGEIAGVVDALGEGVDGLTEGDAVFGIIPSGGFAEFAIARAADLVRKPGNLDFVQSAALPLGALTAWQAMFDIAGLSRGQRLLITASAGGVGSLAVQLAKAHGAHVTGMASTRNEAYVRELGADAFIDYTRQPFEHVASEMDVVFDAVGGDTFARAAGAVREGSVLVTAVAFPAAATLRPGIRVQRVQCKPDAVALARIRDLAEAGKLVPNVGTTLPLAEIRQALELSKTGHAHGKIVLDIAA